MRYGSLDVDPVWAELVRVQSGKRRPVTPPDRWAKQRVLIVHVNALKAFADLTDRFGGHRKAASAKRRDSGGRFMPAQCSFDQAKAGPKDIVS